MDPENEPDPYDYTDYPIEEDEPDPDEGWGYDDDPDFFDERDYEYDDGE